MTHIDLFSGIGGFAYAAQQVWGAEYHNLFFCDNNAFCQAVIRKNFGRNSLIYGDIREVTVERVIADTKKRGLPIIRPARVWGDGFADSIDLLTGGFPCQPFSHAGKRKGNADNRYLFPEMLRVIEEFKPRWVIGENVAGLKSIFQYQGASPLEGRTYGSRKDAEINVDGNIERTGTNELHLVVERLERIGYEVQVFVIPACAVNAPHRRDRVWIVAHAEVERGIGGQGEIRGAKQRQDNELLPESDDADRHAADADRGRLEGGTGECNSSMRYNRGQDPSWEQNWLEVATELCGVDDGLPAGVDGLKLSKSKHREERLKALGNAIVPQVVVPIMEAIKSLESK